MISTINNKKIQGILWVPENRDEEWKSDLERFEKGDVSLNRKSAGESSIKAIQRLCFSWDTQLRPAALLQLTAISAAAPTGPSPSSA